MIRIRVVLLACLLCFIAFSLTAIQKKLTSLVSPSWKIEKMTYLPKSDYIKKYMLGFHTLYADYLWIKTTMYFGSHFLTDKQYPYLATMVDIVSKLNPYFYPAYEFAGVILPDFPENRIKAIEILERGMATFGLTQWKLPFYIGWIYFYYLEDKNKAAHYLSIAARNPKTPPFVAGLAATSLTRINQTDYAISFLQHIYQSGESPSTKKFIESKIIELLNNKRKSN